MGRGLFLVVIDIYLYSSLRHVQFFYRIDFIFEKTSGAGFLPFMRFNCQILYVQSRMQSLLRIPEINGVAA